MKYKYSIKKEIRKFTGGYMKMDANLSMEQIRKDVKNVTELNQEGYDMDVISHKLDLSKDYVQTILTCAQGFTEDDTLAVAVLVEASL